MNWEKKYRVGDRVKTKDAFEKGQEWVYGEVLKIGEETILIKWEDRENESEHPISEFQLVKPA